MNFFYSKFFLIFLSAFSLDIFANSFSRNLNCSSSFEEILSRSLAPERSISEILKDPYLLRNLESKSTAYVNLLKKIDELPVGEIELGKMMEKSTIGRVDKIVPGLYESIPTRGLVKVDGLTISAVNETANRISSHIYDDNRKVGVVERIFYKDEKKMTFFGADLTGSFKKSFGPSAPRFVKVPGTISLVEEKGIPTQTFMTLHQMRLSGLAKGELKFADSTITNKLTLTEIADSMPVRKWVEANPFQSIPNEVVLEAFKGTHTYKYFETVLTQSGHKIDNVIMDYVVHAPASSLAGEVLTEMDNVKSGIFIVQKKLANGRLIPMDSAQPLPSVLVVKFELSPL